MNPGPTFDPASQQPLNEIKITYDDLIDDTRMEESVRTLFLRILKVFGGINANFRSITVDSSQGDKIAVAYQHFQIAAADLSASDDPDDVSVPRSVLATNGLLQSKNQFNWMQSGGVRKSIANLAPGRGSPSHPVIIHRDYVNMNMAKLDPLGSGAEIVAQNVCRAYGLGGLKLQFGEYRANSGELEFWPSSIAVESWIYLEQELPQVVIQ